MNFTSNYSAEPTFYKILGVSCEATPNEIKIAYKKLTRSFHPDKAIINNLPVEKAAEAFKSISEAYETLSDLKKRQDYDDKLKKIKIKLQFFYFFSTYSNNFKNSAAQNVRSDFKFDPTSFSDDLPIIFKKDFVSVFNPKKLSTELQSLVDRNSYIELDRYFNKLEQNDFLQDLSKSMLFYACKGGKINTVKYLIVVQRVNPHLYVDDFYNLEGPLFKVAVSSGNLELVKFLLEEYEVDIESQARRGWRSSALSVAASLGYDEVVAYLISKGAKVNPEVTYSDILDKAINSKNVLVVKLLVEAGSKISDYLLGKALEIGVQPIVEYLLSKKQGLLNHRFLLPPGSLVVRSGNIELVKYLEETEKFSVFDKGSKDQTSSLISLIHSAGASRSIEMLKFLLDERGLSPIIHADEKHAYNLLAAVAKVDWNEIEKQNKGYVVLRFLFEERGFKISEGLINHIVKEHAKFSGLKVKSYLKSYCAGTLWEKKTLLKIALEGLDALSLSDLYKLFNLNHFAEEIHQHIADKNFSLADLRSYFSKNKACMRDALFYYADSFNKSDLSVLQLLVDLGVEIDCENSEGETCLHKGINQVTYNKTVQFFLDNGADIFKKNLRGVTAAENLKLDFDKKDPRLKNYRPLLKAKSPEYIQVASKPLNLGGRIEKISVAEFQKRFDCVYDESIGVLSDKVDLIYEYPSENVSKSVYLYNLKKDIVKVMNSPHDDLVICSMNQFGYGVFAKNQIPKNKVLAIYAGTIIQGTKVKANDHAINYPGTNMSFSTEHHRGIASFMQHMPNIPEEKEFNAHIKNLRKYTYNISENEVRMNEELFSTEFSPRKVLQFSATENISKIYISLNSVPVIVIVSNQLIEAGAQLGFNYGYQYWRSRNVVPVFFDKFGSALLRSFYKRTFGVLNFNTFTYTGEYRPLIKLLETGEITIIIKGDNNNYYTVFSEDLTRVLRKAHAI